MHEHTTPIPMVIRPHRAVERTGLWSRTAHELMLRGDFPASFSLAERSVGWLETEVSAWIQERVSHRPPAPR